MSNTFEEDNARKDDAIAEQARQLREALAELERVKRERDAACADLRINSSCATCEHLDGRMCKMITHGLNKCYWDWRGPCTENGGTEDGI